MKGIKKGKILKAKEKIKNNYKKQLLKFNKAMYKDIIATILKASKTKNNNIIKQTLNELESKYNIATDYIANYVINNFVEETKKDFQKNYSMGWSFEYEKQLQADIFNNVALIKDLPRKAIFEISQDVFNSVADDENKQSLETRLKNRYGITTRRAETIARDQTSKLFATMSEISQKSNGIEYYEWITANDERVSTGKGGHKQLNHKIFKWEEDKEERKPIIDSYGNTGKPAERVNCRCVAYPIFVEDGYQMVWDNSLKSYKTIRK